MIRLNYNILNCKYMNKYKKMTRLRIRIIWLKVQIHYDSTKLWHTNSRI